MNAIRLWNFPIRPEAASSFANKNDALFFTISLLALFFTVVVSAMIIIFAVKFRRGKKADRSNPQHHSVRLEMILMLGPLFLALAIFAWGTAIFIDQRTPPKDSMELFVIGKQWMWHVQHKASGIRENNEIHVPVDTPVRVTLISQDVIHGFYVPEFRQQYHVVPGRYGMTWFKPTKIGKYHLFCTIHCGTQHSEMGGYVYVMSKEDFAKWVANGGNRFKEQPQTPALAGKQLYEELACGNCHGGVDTERGPSLNGLYGRERPLVNGSTKADEDYIRDSIINPYKHIVKGYTNTMPVYIYREQVNEEQIRDLIEYIKTLGMENAKPAPQSGNVQ